jgi:glyoxylase-like metal-dependent hydrolase (beta-lactamase superfamily II)
VIARNGRSVPVVDAPLIASDQYFEYFELFDGVVVGQARPNAKVVCNATIIDLGGLIVVVDAHSRPSAASAVIDFVRRRFDSPVHYVVNTHHHWDHCQGNAAYADQQAPAVILAHPNAIEAMRAGSHKPFDAQLAELPAELTRLDAALTAATDAALTIATDAASTVGAEADRTALATDIEQVRQYAAELPLIQRTLPDRAVEAPLTLAGTRREIRIVHPGPAHTQADLIVQLPGDDAVATGDCVIGWTPFMGDSHPGHWAEALDVVADGPSGTLLMGHGRPADRRWLRTFQRYLADVVAETARCATPGRGGEDLARDARARLADRYQAAFDREGGRHRPWDALVLRNVQHVFGLLSTGVWDASAATSGQQHRWRG